MISNVAQYYLDVGLEDGGLVVQRNPMFGGMSGVLYGLFGYLWMKSRYEPALGLSLNPRRLLDDRLAVPVHDRDARQRRQHGPRRGPDRRRGHRRGAAPVATRTRQTAHVSRPAAFTDQKKYGKAARQSKSPNGP